MCGRYYIEIDEREIQEIIDKIKKTINDSYEQLTFKMSGEIFPTDNVPVITGHDDCQIMKWGFTNFNGNPLINARSETAFEKPTFRKAMLEQRCLIPASGFYEWKKEGSKKVKYEFSTPGSTMFFAGCWRHQSVDNINRFVILTRSAVDGVEDIHDRMPVIIPQRSIERWLGDDPSVMDNPTTKLTKRRVS